LLAHAWFTGAADVAAPAAATAPATLAAVALAAAATAPTAAAAPAAAADQKVPHQRQLVAWRPAGVHLWRGLTRAERGE
jgi:hypothetical protein